MNASPQNVPHVALPPLEPGVSAWSSICDVVAGPGGRTAVVVGGRPVEAERLSSAGEVRPGQRALVVFAGERPVIVGALRDRLEDIVEIPTTTPQALQTPPGTSSLSVWADGREVRVEAADRLELRCGEASIMLRADGKVEIRGTHILSRSSGPNRLKGGSTSIN